MTEPREDVEALRELVVRLENLIKFWMNKADECEARLEQTERDLEDSDNRAHTFSHRAYDDEALLAEADAQAYRYEETIRILEARLEQTKQKLQDCYDAGEFSVNERQSRLEQTERALREIRACKTWPEARAIARAALASSEGELISCSRCTAEFNSKTCGMALPLYQCESARVRRS